MDDRQIATVAQAALKFLPFEASFANDFETLVGKVQLYRSSGGNPNGAQVVRDVHDFWLGCELKEGRHGTPEHMPFNFLPKHRQVADLLVRSIVTALLPLWTEPTPASEEPRTEPETADEAPVEEKLAE